MREQAIDGVPREQDVQREAERHGECVAEMALGGQGIAEVVMRPAVIGVQSDGLPARLDGLVVAAEIAEESPVVRVEPAVVRPEPDCVA